MKKKRLLSILLMVAFLFTLVSPMSALADPVTHTITINNEATGHTYEAYQIFSGNLSEDGVLSNITWGDGITANGKSALLKQFGVETPAAVAKKMQNEGDAKVFAAVAGKAGNLTNPKESTYGEKKYTITGLKPGYYLVKDQDDSLASSKDAYTRFMVSVVKNVTLSPKSSMPTVEKKVKDTNDTQKTTTIWQDSADYDIGDKVPFQLTATLGSSVRDYKAYKLVFHDTLSPGLTFNADSLKVQVGSSTLSSDRYLVNHTQGKLTVTLKDIIADGATNGGTVTVTYDATLNAQAVIGSAGNPNVVYLEYSNNPNTVVKPGPEDTTGGETGKTNEDKVTVFTYQLIIHKTDGHSALEGAAFKLEKKINGENAKQIGEIKTGGSTFTWKGLDDGDYILTEITTPDGYNTMEPIEFTISATHDVESDNPTLTALSATKLGVDGATVQGVLSDGSVSADVVNVSGSTLPETGGIGTTIFYLLGGILVVGAVVLLVAKRRAH